MEAAGGAVGVVWSAALGWLTPAVLFVAMNLVIATIAVASRLVSSSSDDDDEAIPGEPRGLLLRAPSFLAVDRLLRSSLSFSRLGLAADHAQMQPSPRPLSGNDDRVPDPEPEPEPEPSLQQQQQQTAAEAERQREEAGRVERSRSEAAAALEAAPANSRRRAVMAEELDGHGGEGVVEVDARADDFIRRFREQLRLQRLDSILRYRDSLRRTGTA